MRTQVPQIDYGKFLSEQWALHTAPRRKDAPTVISTFAGCGGSSLGYSMAGFRELLAVEWDAHAVECFKLNFPEVPVYHGDIAALSVEECMRLGGLTAPGELDVFDGSPPCQGFSTAGKRQLDDPRNSLFKEYVRLLKGLQPKVFVMENVSGMVKGKMKLVFAVILNELKASGYRVKAVLMNAMYFRVPQSRQRMIFIGVREDLGIEPSHPRPAITPIGVTRFDGRQAVYSDKRYGDTLEKAGRPVGTVTKIGRKFWSRTEEFGPKSYAASGSFPLEYRFTGSTSDLKARVGNSVPPLMMKAVAEHIASNILAATRLPPTSSKNDI